METASGNLVMIDLNTPAPKVFWKGVAVSGIVEIEADSDIERQRVKLRVAETADVSLNELYADMIASGVSVRMAKGEHHG